RSSTWCAWWRCSSPGSTSRGSSTPRIRSSGRPSSSSSACCCGSSGPTGTPRRRPLPSRPPDGYRQREEARELGLPLHPQHAVLAAAGGAAVGLAHAVLQPVPAGKRREPRQADREPGRDASAAQGRPFRLRLAARLPAVEEPRPLLPRDRRPLSLGDAGRAVPGRAADLLAEAPGEPRLGSPDHHLLRHLPDLLLREVHLRHAAGGLEPRPLRRLRAQLLGARQAPDGPAVQVRPPLPPLGSVLSARLDEG